jgi:hypothetical protein
MRSANQLPESLSEDDIERLAQSVRSGIAQDGLGDLEDEPTE